MAKNVDPIKYQIQEIFNRIFDFNNNNIEVLPKETTPTNSSKVNPSFVLTRNGSGYITSVVMTINETTYTKTITRNVNNYITDISVWV